MKIYSGNWRPFCLASNMLIKWDIIIQCDFEELNRPWTSEKIMQKMGKTIIQNHNCALNFKPLNGRHLLDCLIQSKLITDEQCDGLQCSCVIRSMLDIKQLTHLPDTIVHIVIEYKQMLMQLDHVNMIAISHVTLMNLTNFTKIVVSIFV